MNLTNTEVILANLAARWIEIRTQNPSLPGWACDTWIKWVSTGHAVALYQRPGGDWWISTGFAGQVLRPPKVGKPKSK